MLLFLEMTEEEHEKEVIAQAKELLKKKEEMRLFDEKYKKTMEKFKSRLNDPLFMANVEKSICRCYPCFLCGYSADTHASSVNSEEHFFCYNCLEMLSNNRKGLSYKLWNTNRVPIVVYTSDGKVKFDIKTLDGEETKEDADKRQRLWNKLLGVAEESE